MKPTLVILSPKYLANPNDIDGNSRRLIEKIATKKGKTERIYRNTLLFLACSEMSFDKLKSDIRDYLACQKISSEYSTQLGKEQKDDIRKRIDESNKQSDISLVTAYSIILKYSVKNGTEKLVLKQFKESLDSQINNNVISVLKTEEWLLESVGLGTLKSNNLFPTAGQNIKVKDIYEAFLRFDDKPMITGQEAVSKSILRYCSNGEYCIATGDGINFSKFYFQENVPFFEITDVTYWLVDKSLKPVVQTPINSEGGDTVQTLPFLNEPGNETGKKSEDILDAKPLKSISVSGKVLLEHYNQLFNSFIMPLAQNNIEIEIRIKGKSTTSKPLKESSQEYKIVKESAKQMGLNFEEE